MALRLTSNAYRGINAHLHSFFQNKGGWSSFHAGHISDLSRAINQLLPPGYLVDVEQSLQIREFHPDTGERLLRPEPDLTIYRMGTTPHPLPPERETSGNPVPAAVLTLPLLETIELIEDQYYSAIVVYQVIEDAALGRPVTRLELLSPSNKTGSGYVQYREKRNAALRSGVRLVEIDYLHETPSPVKGIADYAHDEPGAFPYRIAVSDPLPDLEHGSTRVYGCHVDEPLPTISLPLADSDQIEIALQPVYETTFASLNVYSQRVDYAELPDRFATYHPVDQSRIRAVMARVQADS